MRILLASASPRRKQLLEQIGWSFDVVCPNVDERPVPGESPEDMVMRLARLKGGSVRVSSPDTLVVSADTAVVAPDGAVFGKPKDEADAARMLCALSGHAHRVCSGLALFLNGVCRCGVSRTTVVFHALEAADVSAYIASGEWRGKAGAYAIQGRGSLLVDSIEGDYSSVVGLPLALLRQLMREHGFSLARMWRD